MECDIRGHRNQCPPNYFCDPRTEYCCEDDDDSRERKPDSSRENLALGDRCNELRKRNPCRTENADCINGRCRCISGYEEENSRCVKKETRRRIHSCPSLAPLTVGGKIKKCEITFSRDRSPKDNCPEGSFCVSYGSPPASGKRLRAGIAEGFCCPKMDSVCPVGNPIYVADQNCEKNCPQDTHFCHQSGEHIWREVCCEKPCVGDQILEGGNCVRDRYDGRSPECPHPGGKLGKRSGRCDSQLKEAISSCKPGMLFIHGKCVEPLCSRGTPLFTKGFNFVRCHGNCTESGTFCEKIYGICCSTK
ncbi:EB module family protein [Trichuris trichiura]|uniref:EB module family protein n=1 Tax=Trichuris trichiura TaxID=36087 RepID=A0A077ZGP8_TRITR|nr:EB module family protein [Trichuris trichiura]